ERCDSPAASACAGCSGAVRFGAACSVVGCAGLDCAGADCVDADCAPAAAAAGCPCCFALGAGADGCADTGATFSTMRAPPARWLPALLAVLALISAS